MIYMKSLSEFINDSIQESRLFEQAFNRDKIMKTLSGKIRQIIENYALILYCRQYDQDNWNLNHWKDELLAQCNNICEIDIKMSGKDAKYKAIKQVFLNQEELNDSEVVFKLLKKKFKEEKITNDDIRKDIAFQISNNIEELIDILSYDYDAIDWVENL